MTSVGTMKVTGKDERRGICLSLAASRAIEHGWTFRAMAGSNGSGREKGTCGAQVPTFGRMPRIARRRGRMAYFFTSSLA